MIFKAAFAAAALLGFAVVDAHLEMSNPVPYSDSITEGSNADNNSPLDASGSDFPCKIKGDYIVAQENQMVIGQPEELHFIGGATHGGGSCQISITSDRAPTKDTEWSVLKSYMGGCMDPSSGGENLGTTASMTTPFVANITIPDSFEPGKYTIAWTWFNRIGNREMYMNCAPITVTGSASKRSEDVEVEKRAASYPPMFIANINGCSTEEMKDVYFPNPGNDVESHGLDTNKIAANQPVCNGTPAWGGAGMAAGDSAPAPSPTVTVNKPVGAVPVNTQPPQTTSEAPAPTPVVPPTGTPEPTPEPSGSGSSSGSSSGALSGPCSDEGLWNCIDGSSFQRCASGAWTVVQPMAAGTECTVGQSADFAIKHAALKPRHLRDMRHQRRARSGHFHA